MKSLPTILFGLLVSLLLNIGWAVAADPAAALESLDRHFAQQLAVLAQKCDSLQLPAQATITREWQVPRGKGRHLLFIPPVNDPHEPAAATPDLVKKWYGKFHELRVDQANGLYDVALEFLAAGDAARAYQLLHEALRENPDHEPIRRGLGYVRAKNKTNWSTYASPPESSPGQTAHPKTGWHAGKYWRIDSPHWRIATNHSPAAGLDLARKLEDFHLLWRILFFDYWCTQADLEAALESGRRLPEPKTPMNVILFKTRDEYLKSLAPNRPNIGLTQGLYADEQQTALFYAGDETVQATWYHEAAHQLFQQWRDSPAGVGEKQNFWIIEGAALYVESLTNHGSHWTAGGWQADRLQIPRYRALAGDTLKLEKLVAMGREAVQNDPEIRKLYSQFAAESHFLFDHADPAYRQAGNVLLREVYQQNDKLTSLAALTGASLGELDQGYLKSLQVTDDDLLHTPRLEKIRNLSLGRTQVTDKGLAALAACRELRWLDLTALPVTDAGLAHLKGATKLDQLFLEGTKISSESLPLIAQFSALEELDLSNVQISDASIMVLGKLRKLKILHLTGSPITAAGVQRLKSLLPKTEIKQ